MTSDRQRVIVSGGFDDPRSRDVRFLEEASRLGRLTVLLWTDEAVERATGRPPAFGFAERAYLLGAVRYVAELVPSDGPPRPDEPPIPPGHAPGTWVDTDAAATAARERFCSDRGFAYRVLSARDLDGFPEPPMPPETGRPRVVVTGCYDWLHSGHVRFMEEASTYGDLYVCLGSDANIRLLKGEGHPRFPQAERRYLVGSIRFVEHAIVNTGSGWLDADPEIRRLKPHVYIVNDDGDKGGKREYCRRLGIEYRVLARTPAPGLPARTSTALRGF